MIETIALVNRTFQQRRLLEGGSTANFNILTRMLDQAHDTLFVKEKPRPNSFHRQI